MLNADTNLDVGKMSALETTTPEPGQATPRTPDEGEFLIQPKEHVTISSKEKFEDIYEVEKELGRGKFGVVYKCKHKTDGTLWAAKIVRCREKDKIGLRREIEIMNKLRHPKLLILWDAFETPRQMVLVMEYVGAGELFERVIGDEYVLTELDCIHFLRQICEGMSYVHKSGILHLDLKPENILCVSENSNRIKIIDFGLAQFFKPGQSMKVLFGTPEFVAPEVISYEEIGYATDMWSLGVICYVLLSGLSPFLGDSEAETLSNVTSGLFDFDDEAFDEISETAKDFIAQLLVKNMKKRMLTDQCLTHAWLNQDEADGSSGKRLNTERLKRFMIRRKWLKTGNAVKAVSRLLKSQSSFGLLSKRSSSDSLLDTPSPSTPPPFSTNFPPEDSSENNKILSEENSITEASSPKLGHSNQNLDHRTSDEDSSPERDHKCPTPNDSSKTSEKSDSGNGILTCPLRDNAISLAGVSLEKENKPNCSNEQKDNPIISKDHILTPTAGDKKDIMIKAASLSVSSLSVTLSSSSFGEDRSLHKNTCKVDTANLPEITDTALQAPEFTKSMAKCKTCSGDVARFTVMVSGKPFPQVSWLFEDEKIEEDSRHVLACNEKTGLFSLTVRNVNEADDGEYTCKAVNSQGECICSAELSVLEL